MAKFRTGIWILIVLLLMVLFFQNQSIFLSSSTLQLNLYLVKYQTPELPAGVLYLATLIIGFLIAYLFSLADRFKSRRIMKNLSAALDARQQEVVSLKKEIEALKRVPPPEPPAVETPRPDRAVEMEEEPAAPAAEETRPAPPKETGDTEDADEKKGSQY